MKLIYYISLVLITAAMAQAQQPARLNCLEVALNGDVTLNWQLLPEPGLLETEIYYSANGSTFTKIATLLPAMLTYTHAGADAELGTRHYYIKAVYTSAGFNSDTLRTIYLQVDNNQPDFNLAGLQWSALNSPPPEGYSGYYKIFRESPFGTWQLHDSVPVDQTSYTEPVIVCNDSITYQVVIEHSSGCQSASNMRGAIFRDVEYPLEPVFDSVSINAGGFAILGWSPSSSNDVTGYIVYRFEASNWNEIDRVDGRDSTFYIDTVSDPCNRSIVYAIAALDSCANKSPGTFANPRNTLLLNDIDYDVCNKTNTLNWNAYNNADPALEHYNVYVSTDNGGFQLAGQAPSGALSFVHGNVQTGFNYTYYVQAVFGQKSSSSCKKSVTTFGYALPGFIYFASADVLLSNNIELTIEPDTAVTYCTLNVFRNDPRSGITSQVAGIYCGDISDIPYRILDETADPTLGSYYYHAEVMDSCGEQVLISNENKTIFLTAENLSTNSNYLQWNAYEGWDAGVEKYYIFRIADGIEPAFPVDSVDATVLEYTDDISGVDNSVVNLSYRVQALESNGNEYGFKERANSNRAAVAIASEMFLPNAFRPGGYTPEFKPVFRFFGGQLYLFQIYNRWGQLIFETTDPQTGWDGIYLGNRVQQGTYVYRLVYQNTDAGSVEKKGVVTVVY